MRIAVDSESIYWRTSVGDVFSIGKNGGLVSLLFEATDCDPGDNCGDFLAQNDSDIFWVDQPHGQILGRAKIGGETRVIVENAAYPRTLVADAEFVYWSAFLYDEVGDVLSVVQRRPIAGGEIELLHSRSEFPRTLDYAVLTNGFLYGDWNYEGIWKIAADGSSAELLIPDAHPRRLASDGVMLYWTESTGSGVAPLVLAAPLSGGGPIPVACSKKSGTGLGAESPLAIAVDESGVYWADERSDRIMAADLVRMEASN